MPAPAPCPGSCSQGAPPFRPAAACRDLLRAYAALQQFKPKPAAKSQCYTGARLLEQFGTPHEADAAAVARAYPWLQGYDAGCAAAEAQWGSF